MSNKPSSSEKRPNRSADGSERAAKVSRQDETATDEYEVPNSNQKECSGDAKKQDDFVEEVCTL